MGLGALYKPELEALVRGGVTLALRNAQCQGASSVYLLGILTLAEYMCTTRGIHWGPFVEETKAQLGKQTAELLDQTLLKLEAATQHLDTSPLP